MRYVPPYGRESEGDAAQYVNGDPSIGRQGSIPPANAFEHPMREIVGVIEKSKMTALATDLLQLPKSVRSQRLNYADDTGSQNAVSVAFDPPLTAYTIGLPLHVKIKTTNSGASTINAGAGTTAIRRMNGADVGAGDLPGGGVVFLVFDGTYFQLVNFSGTGGEGDVTVFNVKIPYTVDTGTPGHIIANFTNQPNTFVPGDMIAVKIKETTPGNTTIDVNTTPTSSSINVLPNSGGPMLQGDIHSGDVMIFIYDGTSFYIQPNPEINAPVIYTIGAGQQFPSIDAAISILKRKTIGSNGVVTLKMIAGAYPPFTVNHVSADRIIIQGTMSAQGAPTWDKFAATGNTPAARNQDAITNIAMLRGRYLTEIQVPSGPSTQGVANVGPGMLRIMDLLIAGQNLPTNNTVGVYSLPGYQMWAQNVACWGLDFGFYCSYTLFAYACWVSSAQRYGYACAAPGEMALDGCGAFGCALQGFSSSGGGITFTQGCIALQTGGGGMVAYDHSYLGARNSYVVGSGSYDMHAVNLGEIVTYQATYGTISPALNTLGNNSALIAFGG